MQLENKSLEMIVSLKDQNASMILTRSNLVRKTIQKFVTELGSAKENKDASVRLAIPVTIVRQKSKINYKLVSKVENVMMELFVILSMVVSVRLKIFSMLVEKIKNYGVL